MASEKEYSLIGLYTRYSSWTARVALLMDYYGIPYDSQSFQLAEGTKLSRSGLVPALVVRSLGPDFQVNESIAICEFLAESHPDLPLWPKDRALRASARSAVARMHAGLCPVLRTHYHTNALARYTGNVPMVEGVIKEVENILDLWGSSRRETVARMKELGQTDEGFLFGTFSVADAFFWPVLWRFRSYNLPLASASPEAIAWMKKMWSDPKVKETIHDYFLQSERPETTVAKYEDIFKGNPEVQYSYFPEDWEFTA